ncbi:MAG: DUF29 domain-containing protein [Cyanobacteria bacterium J06638_22]
MHKPTILYDADFNQWVDAQVAALRAEKFATLDLPHLVEELEGLTKRDKRALKSYLRVLLIHRQTVACPRGSAK